MSDGPRAQAWLMRRRLEAARASASWRSGGRARVLACLALTQWLAWGSTYYLVTIVAPDVAADTGWSLSTVVGGLSFGLLVAGMASPLVGRAIEHHGGRPILALGCAMLAFGLAMLGLAEDLLVYFAAWAVLGFGMAASFYDAAFAALGWYYRGEARQMIAGLTLLGGLVMTVTWPLTAAMTHAIGWRGTCLTYAALHLAVGLPLLLLLPSEPQLADRPRAETTDEGLASGTTIAGGRRRALLGLLGANLTLQIGIGSVLAVNLLSVLQRLHFGVATAVALGSVMGACQVASRLIEISVVRHVHPVWEGIGASALVALGLALLLTGSPALITLALIVYGFGNGVRTIVKGTLPLVLFGAEGYARRIGLLGLPTLIAQAVGPALGALALTRYGVRATLVALTLLALINLVLGWLLRSGMPGDTTPARLFAGTALKSAARRASGDLR